MNTKGKVGPALAGSASLLCLLGAVNAASGWGTFWLSVGTLGMGVEAYALHRKAKGDTLSETVWLETASTPRRVALGVFMLWLAVHFVFRVGA